MSFSGPIAWYHWLVVHLWYIIGFRNRLQVLLSWAYNYFTYDRSARAVIGLPQRRESAPVDAAAPAAPAPADDLTTGLAERMRAG
jgi:NADH dehydrogenase